MRFSWKKSAGLLSETIRDPLLIEMLLCPLMWYGNARENDMDFGQFCIMFRACYLEGFGRPFKGVRVILTHASLESVSEHLGESTPAQRWQDLSALSDEAGGADLVQGGVSAEFIDFDDNGLLQAERRATDIAHGCESAHQVGIDVDEPVALVDV